MAFKRKRVGDDEEAGNIFDASAAATAALNNARAASRSIGALNSGLRQSNAMGDAKSSRSRCAWDDRDGYYLAIVGELIADRYMVVENACGKGVYSSIIKAKPVAAASEEPQMVAIKVVRANALMREAAAKEIRILEKIQSAEGESKRHIVRMFSSFAYRDHVCMVFECMWDDCREALRRLTKGRGMTLSVVRSFAQQLLFGLRHLHRCGVLHADIKPDNILISQCQGIVKFCDLGSATELADVEVSPYIMSRFYRAPEVIIGCKPTAAVDTFALACTLFELFAGKTLFAGKGNHDQLRKVMELMGKLPKALIREGTFWKRHFDEAMNFKADVEADPRRAAAEDLEGGGLRLKIARLKASMDTFPKSSIREHVFERVGPDRAKSSSEDDVKYVQRAERFAELLEEMLALTPAKRASPADALRHAFFT